MLDTATAFSDLIPAFAERIVHVGAAPHGACRQFYARRGSVWHLPGIPRLADRLEGAEFDCLVIEVEEGRLDPRVDLSPLLRYLNSNGRIVFLSEGGTAGEDQEREYDWLLSRHGLLHFKTMALAPEPAAAPWVGVVAVRCGYNPAEHARALGLQGQHERALSVLAEIPHELLETDENLSLLAAEKQRLYLCWQQSLPNDQPVHRLFFKARREFARVTAALPHHAPAYCQEARFWLHLSQPAMARRTLRSILHVAPDPLCRRELESLPEAFPGPAAGAAAVAWSGVRRPPRMLILTHEHSDYGMDTLYDALVRAIGAENVVEYPWKPSLHGWQPETAHNYPCAFDHRSAPMPLDAILADLRMQRFDLILYADVVQMTRKAEVQRIMEAGRDLPLIVYDTWDDCYTPVDLILAYIGGKPIDLLFKREVLAGVDYGSSVVPLPFGYPDGLIPSSEPKGRSSEVFWAGKRVWGLRALYLPAVERMLGTPLREAYPQAEYAERLRKARIGLSFFGSGFDTVRYWEIPAHGAMLLAERPPIHIPYNFVDGESAVFFGDLPELEGKLDYYRSQRDAAEQIAAAGHCHLLKHHTTSARACQFLGHLEQRLSW